MLKNPFYFGQFEYPVKSGIWYIGSYPSFTSKEIFDKVHLSTRGYYRILKTARTIADLEESETVEAPHISEAFQLRVREK